MSRYTITEKEPFQETRVFRVTTAEETKPWQGVDVWVADYGVACTNCSSILKAMSASCNHASAVKRYLAKNRSQT